MRRGILFALIILTAAGCRGAAPGVTEPKPPLTIAEWKALPVEIKYQAETFERLKEGDASLADEQKWYTFHKSVILPSRQRELPKRAK